MVAGKEVSYLNRRNRAHNFYVLGKKRIARENLVAVIPLVRVLNRVGIHIPLAVDRVPVRVHGPMCDMPSMPLSFEYSRDCIVFEALKAP